MLKPKLKHLRHPLRTLNLAKNMLAARAEMHAFSAQSDKKFAGDPRYQLQHVTTGFACRQVSDVDDTALLDRICAAYNATVEHPESSHPSYRATGWWQQIRDRSLGPVRQALRMRDIAALRAMYSNFFRDPCCTGLTAVPYGMIDVYFGGRMTDLHRSIYLADALYRLDYWKGETGGRFSLSDLAIPSIGNPFGVCLEGTLLSARAEFQHSCAVRLAGLLEAESSTVAEIGGGFGGMAYYLLRDRPETKYFDFDVPESIALATYFLMKSFPHKSFLLFGEGPLTEEAIADADVVLMPLFEMKRLQDAGTDVTFSSHAMTDIEVKELASYLETIHRITRNRFLFLGTSSLPNLRGLIGGNYDLFRLEERRYLHWHRHRRSGVDDVECLYSFDQADSQRLSAERDMAHVHP
jgi:O-methyltransferase domain